MARVAARHFPLVAVALAETDRLFRLVEEMMANRLAVFALTSAERLAARFEESLRGRRGALPDLVVLDARLVDADFVNRWNVLGRRLTLPPLVLLGTPVEPSHPSRHLGNRIAALGQRSDAEDVVMAVLHLLRGDFQAPRTRARSYTNEIEPAMTLDTPVTSFRAG